MSNNALRMPPRPSLRNWLYTNIVYPKLQPQTFAGLRNRVQRHAQRERLTLEQSQQQQWRDLKRILEHAYTTTEFYKQRFDRAGIHPEEIRNPADLTALPILERDELKSSVERMLSSKFPREQLRLTKTGGTSSASVPFYRDPDGEREKYALQLRFQEWAGMFPGDKVAYLWGSPWDYPQKPSWRWWIYDQHIMRNLWLPTVGMDAQLMETYRQQINRFKPKILYAYPTPLAFFCRFLKETGRPYVRPKAVICTAEELGPHRQVIEEVFQAPVYEHYGSREFGIMAAQCEYGAMHLSPALTYVEFLPVANAADEGLCEMIVTDLVNYGMPLIRYRIRDCVLLGNRACPCGRGFRVIDKIAGRSATLFTMPSGKVVMGLNATLYLSPACPEIKEMQIIQDTLHDFRLRYVAREPLDEAAFARLRQHLEVFFGPDLKWTFESISAIAPEKSGKTRYCVSYVTPGQTEEKAGGKLS